MDKKLVTLLKEMEVTDDIQSGFNSDNSIRAKAYLKVDKLSKSEYISQLFDYLDVEKNETNRENAYFILGHLLQKMPEYTQIQRLIDSLKKEKSSNIIVVILDELSGMALNKPMNIKPILDLTEHKSWKIRHKAILALSKADQEIAKTRLRTIIQEFEKKKDKLDVVYAVAVIGQIGDNSDITALQKLLSSKIKDIRDSAQFAIQRIEDSQMHR